ncbi:MAG: hypothetical protein ACH350_06510 [Parachlamydiaceae bacterium]
MNVRSILFTLLLCVPSLMFAGIAGGYRVKGTDPDGTTYTGSLLIQKEACGVYSFAWNLDDGSNYLGEAIQQKNGLSVAFDSSGSRPGVQSYKISKNRIEGPFIYIGDTSKGYEIAKKVTR